MTETAVRFEGHEGRECSEHRTTGPRAWCFDCQEWCYQGIPCKGCELPGLRTAIERIRAVVGALPALGSLDRNDAGFLFHIGQHDMADRVRVFLPAPHSPAEPVSPVSTPTGATGGAGEAQEAGE